jgi:hypothetical protein
MVGWRAKLGFLVPAGTPTVEPEMFEMAPKGVSVHFGRMISRGADGTLNGIEARIATQIEHLDESVEMLSMIKPDVITLAHTATSYYLGREIEAELTKRLEDRFGLHFITAFGSVIAALNALGIKKVALGTPYDENLTMQGKPFLRPGLQAFVGCAKGIVTGVFGFGGFPGVELGFDVAFEDFGQVVVAVKLVFVGNASEGLDGVEYGHSSQFPAVGWHTAASTCIQGLGSVVRVSCTHWR